MLSSMFMINSCKPQKKKKGDTDTVNISHLDSYFQNLSSFHMTVTQTLPKQAHIKKLRSS